MKRLMSAVALVYLLAVGCVSTDASTSPVTNSPAAQEDLTQEDLTQEDLTQEDPAIPEPTPSEPNPMSQDALTPDVQQAILQAVSQQQDVPVEQLEITSLEAADWPDACLGLAGPDEMCAQMITPGWALTITGQQQTWQYRTDLNALQVKAVE
ncbi:MAG: hypothetical protein AAFS04_01960 [Cyanobacteria bacterium J06631_9]